MSALIPHMYRFVGLGDEQQGSDALSVCKSACLLTSDRDSTTGPYSMPACLDDCEMRYGTKGYVLRIGGGALAGMALGALTVLMFPKLRVKNNAYLVGAGIGAAVGSAGGVALPYILEQI